MADRSAASIGLMTTGTIPAVGVSAAHIAMAVGLRESVGSETDPVVMFLAAICAIASVVAHAFTMLFGLAVRVTVPRICH